MNSIQSAAFKGELALARDLMTAGDLNAAFAHLERAHIIGQAFIVPHVMTHWLMLEVEWRKGRLAAVVGQAVRIALSAPGSAVGVIPTGNTGGTDISMFRRMPVETALQAVIDGHEPAEFSGRRP